MNVWEQGRDGRWLPAIPEAYPLLIRHRCACGRKFWTRDGYRAHYAVVYLQLPADLFR